jgi:hypothetical protein
MLNRLHINNLLLQSMFNSEKTSLIFEESE